MNNEHTNPDAFDDIEVTTATQSAAEVETRLAAEAGKEAPPAKPAKRADEVKPVEKVAAAATEEQPDELSAEEIAALDALEPPSADVLAGTAKETPDQTTKRRTRAQKKVLKEISRRKSAETELTTVRTENATLRAQLETRQSGNEPPAQKKPGDTGDATASTVATDEKFKFDKWEEWSAKNPDAEYPDYMDARDDARDQWKSARQATTTAQREHETATAAAFTTVQAAEADFKTKTPDYDTVVSTVKMMGTQSADGKFLPSGGTIALQQELLRAGADAPKLNYFLGKNPKTAEALMSAASPREFLVLWGQTMLRATGEAPTPPVTETTVVENKPPKPAKPATRAAAPLEPVRGTSTHELSLAEISEEDDEDADRYIQESRRRNGLSR